MMRTAAAVAMVVMGCGGGSIRADDTAIEFFESKIRPVLVERCYGCHSAEAKKQRGGLLLDSRAALLKGGDTGPALKVGSPGESLLIKAIRYDDPSFKMPPDGKLPASVVADFERWIAGGAVDPRDGTKAVAAGINLAEGRKFWSLRPPVMPKLPEVKDASWPRTAIDRFILAKLEAEGIVPAKPADARQLIRRTTFDLIGLPPTPEEVEAFAADPTPDAFEKVVDRLLKSPHYGERWGRHWLDVARYAEDQAHTFGVKPNAAAYRYRDWVIESLNADMPYDQFVKLQIAADLMNLPEVERSRQLPALGFFGLGAQYYKNSDAAKAAADELDDRVDTLSRGFLGLTVSCARCHDHKYDPIPQADYYSLAGVFSSCKVADIPLSSKATAVRFNEGQSLLKKLEQEQKAFAKAEKNAIAESRSGAIGASVVAAWRYHAIGKGVKNIEAPDATVPPGQSKEMLERWVKFMQKPPKLAAFEPCRQMFAQTDLGAADRVAEAGRALQSQVEAALAARKAGSLDKERGDLLNAFFGDACPLAPSDDELAKSLPPEKKRSLDQFAARSSQIKKDYPQSPPASAHGLAEAKPQDMKVFLRGNPAKLGEVAPRRFLRAIAGDAPPPFSATSSGRLELAEAIASRDNPLTARVIVNRLWQRHFGRGIVGSASNFGELGDRPTHPELLDYLAVRLMDQGWSLKAIHREILLSSVYRLSAEASDANLAKDADNRWLWRRERARIDIESWRDAILSVSGKLDATMGGPTFDLNNAAIGRRTVYAKVSRHDLNATLRLFDFPDANITSERRVATTVPQQQLFALNSPFVVESAKAFAARLTKEASTDEARIRRGFALAFGRPARDDEVRLLTGYLAGSDSADVAGAIRLTRWERLAQSLLVSNEFQYVD